VTGQALSRGFLGNIDRFMLALEELEQVLLHYTLYRPYLALVYDLRNVSVVVRCPKYWDIL